MTELATSSNYVLNKGLTSRILTPSLVVFRDKVSHNINTMIAAMDRNPLRWRPHVKTVKSPALIRELVRAGVRKFKCATPREARELCKVLTAEGVAAASDVLVAFPHTGANLQLVGAVRCSRWW